MPSSSLKPQGRVFHMFATVATKKSRKVKCTIVKVLEESTPLALSLEHSAEGAVKESHQITRNHSRRATKLSGDIVLNLRLESGPSH